MRAIASLDQSSSCAGEGCGVSGRMVGFIVVVRLSRRPPRRGLGVLCALQAVAGLGPRRPRRASELLTFRGRRAAGAASPVSLLRANTAPQDRVSRHLNCYRASIVAPWAMLLCPAHGDRHRERARETSGRTGTAAESVGLGDPVAVSRTWVVSPAEPSGLIAPGSS